MHPQDQATLQEAAIVAGLVILSALFSIGVKRYFLWRNKV